MWFGTEAGWRNLTDDITQTINDPALPTGRVHGITVDQDGRCGSALKEAPRATRRMASRR
jgi:hypothetical protein